MMHLNSIETVCFLYNMECMYSILCVCVCVCVCSMCGVHVIGIRNSYMHKSAHIPFNCQY